MAIYGVTAHLYCTVLETGKSYLFESNELCLFAEASSANVEVVLANKSLVNTADSALSGVFAVVSWVRVQLLLHLTDFSWHLSF